jgi:hypothetical protein
VRNAGLITASNLSIDCYVGRTVLRTLIVFCHHIVLYFLGLALLLVPLSWTSLLSLVGIALLFINGYWIGVVLAFLCARFRDLSKSSATCCSSPFSSRRCSENGPRGQQQARDRRLHCPVLFHRDHSRALARASSAFGITRSRPAARSSAI